MAKLVYTDPSGREITERLGPDSPVVTVGRARDCTIRSNRKSVSRRHAKFQYNDGRFEVADLGSSNGTYIIVDNRRKPVESPEMLTHRDEIWCGDFILYFVQEEAESSMGANSASGPQQSVSNNVPGGPGEGAPPPVAPGRDGGVGGAVIAGDNAGGSVSMGRNAQANTEPPPGGGGGGVSPGIADAESVVLDDSDDELQRLRDEKQSIQALADRQTRRVEELEAEVETLRTELDEARANAGDPDEMARLQQEIADRDRDLGILEKELEREVEAGQRLQDSLDEYEQRIDELEAERAQLEEQLQQTRGERNQLRDQLDDQDSPTTRIEEPPEAVLQLEEQLEQARNDGGVSQSDLEELAELARQLERTVDAIARTDLSPLSTVDRVRLESAIRDTAPRQTLRRMLEIAGADDE